MRPRGRPSRRAVEQRHLGVLGRTVLWRAVSFSRKINLGGGTHEGSPGNIRTRGDEVVEVLSGLVLPNLDGLRLSRAPYTSASVDFSVASVSCVPAWRMTSRRVRPRAPRRLQARPLPRRWAAIGLCTTIGVADGDGGEGGTDAGAHRRHQACVRPRPRRRRSCACTGSTGDREAEPPERDRGFEVGSSAGEPVRGDGIRRGDDDGKA